MKTNIISYNQYRIGKIERKKNALWRFEYCDDYRISIGGNVESKKMIQIEMLLVNLKVKFPHTKTYYTIL